jgi:type VI secretion system protein VasG
MQQTLSADDLRRLIGRFDVQALKGLDGATVLCQTRGHYEIAPEHVLLRLLDDVRGDLAAIFETFKVDAGQVRRGLQQALEAFPAGHRGKPALSRQLVEIAQAAAVLADELISEQIRPGLLLLAIALNPDHTKLAEFSAELDRIDVDQLRDNFHEIISGGPRSTIDGVAGSSGPVGRDGDSALAMFTIDLTAKAQAGQIDPVFGRDQEIRQMIDIFARRRKNNPILVGEPGTGKTAIVEGLALRIAEGDVPPTLKDVRLICLDLGLLQAGASVKGEFENRLKNVIKEIKSSEQPIITFIDEAHTLIGAGGTAGGSDAANLLKPALARGELRTCAATTWAEYKKYFEKDAALERRFQLVRCDEPDEENAIVMLRGLKGRYQKHHKVVVSDAAVAAAVILSKRYISGRFLPDKAVDLLDTAAARVAVGLSTRPAPLEDCDRELGHLETAISAMRQDEANGLSPDWAELDELEAARERTIQDQTDTEQRWQAELAAVTRVRELRSTLSGNSNGEATEEESEAAQDQATAAPVDEAALRSEIDDAVSNLEEMQGEAPLLHDHVDASAVAAVVADWTGIPVGNMVKDEIEAALNMEERLRARVVGQDHALNIISEKLRASKAGIGNPTRPMGVFLCVGPSGVGKTELATAIADLLFGGDHAMTSINMSEFMESHTVSQLKGSPPGYVGYGEGGVLTEAVRQHPYSVVLLDEIEKAHPDVMNLFYQVFDKGVLADGEGRIIDFKNTVIVMTSNLGTDVIQTMCEEEEDIDIDDLKEAVYPHLREHLKPALVARMTVIPFLTLGEEILCDIARMKFRKLSERVSAAHGMAMDIDDAVYKAIADRCQQVDLGARQIDHALDQEVMPELSRELLQQMAAEEMPARVRMGVDGENNFTYEFSQ